MKLDQKILKAINEGLRKSLLSFDDIEFDKSSSNNINQKISSSVKDWKLIQENFVDLGLPSGTLWSKHNLGATCQNTVESWYGDYYMWGSTTPNTNDNCSWMNAPFNNGFKNYSSGYFINHKQNYIGRDGDLLLDYDVAFQMNNLMCMPSVEQMNELISLPNKWIENYRDINGLNGRLFIGTNGNKLFIPVAGFRHGDNSYNQGSFGYLWSSLLSQDDSRGDEAYFLYFYAGSIYIGNNERRHGYSIRPVLC